MAWANYETGVTPFTVRISGSYVVCKFDTEVLVSNPSGQPGPYTYDLFANSTVVAPWGSPVDNGSATWINAFGYNTGDIIYVKLEATAGNGATVT